MATKTSPKIKKKGWVVVVFDDIISNMQATEGNFSAWGRAFFTDYREAKIFQASFMAAGESAQNPCIVRCTIEFALPRKVKKARRV